MNNHKIYICYKDLLDHVSILNGVADVCILLQVYTLELKYIAWSVFDDIMLFQIEKKSYTVLRLLVICSLLKLLHLIFKVL